MSDLKKALKDLYEQRSTLKAQLTEAISLIKPNSLGSDSFREADNLFLKLKKIEQLIKDVEDQLDFIEKPPDYGGGGTVGRAK